VLKAFHEFPAEVEKHLDQADGIRDHPRIPICHGTKGAAAT
jgi:hypothetical protein